MERIEKDYRSGRNRAYGGRLIVGAMSGTSCDGVDAALVEMWGRGLGRAARLIGFFHRDFEAALRSELLEVRAGGTAALDRVAELTAQVSELYARAVRALLDEAGVAAADVEAIGAHGQTLFHRPPWTTQVLDPALVAARTGIAVVSDFRRADCAVGGQGAPLVPLVDYLLLRDERIDRVAINLGGIANCTILRAGGKIEEVRAWDAGPGNCVVDHLMNARGGAPIDRGGEIALRGREVPGVVAAVLAEEYFRRSAPKSTDGPEMIRIIQRAAGPDMKLADALATTCAVTAAALVESIVREMGGKSAAIELICSGGGTHNAAIMQALRRRAEEQLGARVLLTDELGVNGQAKEAMAFAILAACTLDGEPGNVPSVTGAERAVVLGSITPRPIFVRQKAEIAPPRLVADRSALLTEQRLAASMNLDAMPIPQALELMNDQDEEAVAAVRSQHAAIAAAIEIIAARLRGGGRLFYCGAGTSGRLGVLDASECPPTFGTDPRVVQAIIAGGDRAVFVAVEGAEDDASAGAAAIDGRGIGANDAVVGIAAGGTTPFVIGALETAKARGAGTVLVCCVERRAGEPAVDVVIRLLTGAEVLTGSTRLKAGTVTKLVLNAISTLVMVQLGKVYENLMVDLRATNQKLWDRGARLVAMLSGIERAEALEVLREAGGSVKVAVVMRRQGVGREAAEAALAAARGDLRAALGETAEATRPNAAALPSSQSRSRG